jgi:hypothetical protein
MSRSSFALTLSALLTLFAWIGSAGAADKSAASVFLKGMAGFGAVSAEEF